MASHFYWIESGTSYNGDERTAYAELVGCNCCNTATFRIDYHECQRDGGLINLNREQLLRLAKAAKAAAKTLPRR